MQSIKPDSLPCHRHNFVIAVLRYFSLEKFSRVRVKGKG